MARLFTTNLPQGSESDLEVQLDPPEAQDTENAQNTRNMTVAPLGKIKVNGSVIKKKLNGTWMKLANLPPQELVSELKVREKFNDIVLYYF